VPARPAPALADPAQAAVRERSNADALAGAEAIEGRGERPDTGIGLGVDVDPDGRPSHENLLKPRDTDAATTEREAAPAVNWAVLLHRNADARRGHAGFRNGTGQRSWRPGLRSAWDGSEE
jgi:hypothetical protein